MDELSKQRAARLAGYAVVPGGALSQPMKRVEGAKTAQEELEELEGQVSDMGSQMRGTGA